MKSIFQVDDIRHFKSHVKGWCNWTKKDSSHYHCWENVSHQCEMCHKRMFQLKCNTKWNGPYEINALHCISCTQVLCKLCGEHVQDYNYYLHFYITGINSALKEVAKLCPYKTYLDKSYQTKDFPCEVCANDKMQEERKTYVERVGIKYRNFINTETLEQTSIVTNAGKDILVCPYTDNEVQSTICLRDAVMKLEKKVNKGVKWIDREYIRLGYEYTGGTLRHKTKFDLMCEHKKHMDLHEEKRLETHVVELTLAEAYTSQNDLKIIDTLLKTNIENFEQVLKIQAIVPAECLGFQLHSKHWKRQEAWLAVVDPKYITEPVCSHPDSRDLEKPEKIGMMSKIKEEKKTVYMIVHTHEGSLDEPVEYFEESPLYPAWVLKSKLLFTWTVKNILMEENKSIQKSLIRGEFIQSKRYPSYLMNLSNYWICDCDCCFSPISTCAISDNHNVPANGCPLPIERSPLQEITSSASSKLELWEDMFKFAWKKVKASNEIDTDLSSDSESSENGKETESETDDEEDSDNWWPDL